MYQISKITRHILAMVGIIALIAACSRNPVTGKKELSFMSEQQELALGKQSDPSVVAQFGLYEDNTLQRFIDQKGQTMARISHRPQLPFHFKILDSPVVNAFALPGGYVYFTRGIMAHFNNEAEFAGVLGHEIGHVTARHGARQQTSQLLGNIALVGGMILSPEVRERGQEAAQAMQLLQLSYGRNHESESDKLGVEYSTTIGYDARQMGDFFQTLHRLSGGDEGQRIPTFMSTHPDPLDRYNKVHQMAGEAQAKDARTDFKVGRDSYLKMIDGLVYGEDPRQGYVENGVFYHPELKFQFRIPNGWQYQNSPTVFQMAEPKGNAALYLTLGQGKTLNEAVQNDVQQNKLENVQSSQTKVNGLPAVRVLASQTGQGQNGEQISIRILTHYIQYGDLIYKMQGLAYAQTFNQFSRPIESSSTSFAKLTDASKLNKQPERIKIVTASKTMPLQTALSSHGVPADRIEELAIVNGMKRTDQLKQGQLFKIVK